MLSFRLFAAVYEERSFTAAAAREHSTQSGVSQHIRKLEERHGVTLFVRMNRRVTPTPAADVFYLHCVEALRATRAAENVLRACTNGLMPTVTAGALAPAVLEFRKRNPAAAVRIVEGFSGTLTAMVLAGEVDFAVVPAAAAQTGLRFRPFLQTDEVFVTRRQAGPLPSTALAVKDLPPLRLILPEPGNARAGTIRAYLSAQLVAIDDVLEIDSMMATVDLIARSDWCAILPALLTAATPVRNNLTVRRLTPPLTLNLVTAEPAGRPPSPAATAFHQLLRASCERLLE
jgi:LysR family nitrogen assimilation transcriptional regulator